MAKRTIPLRNAQTASRKTARKPVRRSEGRKDWSVRRRRCSPRSWSFRSASTSVGRLARISAIGGRFPSTRKMASAGKCSAATMRC